MTQVLPDMETPAPQPPTEAADMGGGTTGDVYTLPNDDGSCPGNCRQIPWRAGSDLWNGGNLPTYAGVTCAGLHADGATDDSAGINSCINAAAAGTAVLLPAGTYFVNSPIRLKSSVVLRGAGANATTINLGASGTLTTQNFSFSYDVQPPVSYAVLSTGYLLSGAPKKGDTSLTLVNAGDANVGDWISVGSDDDPSLVSADGTDGTCSWCADNTGHHLMQQIVQVTAKSGSTVTISRPLYYPLYTTPQFRRYSFNTQRAGYENFKAVGYADLGAGSIIELWGCLECWVKGVETYNTGSSSNSAHVRLAQSYGCEVRDSYLHFGRSSASGSNYGVHVEFVNSDHKIENNILRNNRHSFVFEGGGSGVAVLYNYIDDNYTDDLSYLGSARVSHGAHPYMNLIEGNIISHVVADDYLGSSSHLAFFRNWLRGDETGTGVPQLPSSRFYAIDVFPMNTYYSFVGNVLGGPAGGHVDWSGSTLLSSGDASCDNSVVYGYGCGDVGYSAAPKATSINHGNYDFTTHSVAYWDGGTVHALPASMYYAQKPTWWGTQTWPPIGPDVAGYTGSIPAKDRYDGK
jgi:hypothetical protein